MAKISFKISARTAKLIGRENFANAEGALIELVKNCYDADATKCFVIFDIKFEHIPDFLSINDFRKYSQENPIIKSSYKKEKDRYILNEDINQTTTTSLKELFYTENSIYIIDNGDGMEVDTVINQWMLIGTGNKENYYESDDGRIKTGAKGIGRFALDRLGHQSEMWTISKNNRKKGAYWRMDWRQFDKEGTKLTDVKADLEETPVNLNELMREAFSSSIVLSEKVDKIKFTNGTVIKITGLKDDWLEGNLDNVFRSLEALIPPKELQIPFDVAFFSLQYPNQFGGVETAYFNDYDYKVDSEFDAESFKINFTITRNELDLKEVENKYAYLFKNTTRPYDLKTLLNKKFQTTKTVFEVLKWEKERNNTSLLRNLGSFSFSFYYLRNTNVKDYPYKNINATERQRVLRKFGGIKIYRDSFRVRPYGDIGNDWLKLGERAAQSPAGAGQRIGDWRVGPNQIVYRPLINWTVFQR